MVHCLFMEFYVYTLGYKGGLYFLSMDTNCLLMNPNQQRRGNQNRSTNCHEPPTVAVAFSSSLRGNVA